MKYFLCPKKLLCNFWDLRKPLVFRETGNPSDFLVHRKSNGNQRFPVDTENPLDFRVSSIFACFIIEFDCIYFLNNFYY